MKSLLMFVAGASAASALHNAVRGDVWLAMIGVLICGLNILAALNQEAA